MIPTRAQVQGLAALAVHDPARGFDDDVVAMTAAAGATRHGAVTVASRARDHHGRAVPSPATCSGVVDGDFVVIGDDLAAVAVEVLDRLLSGGGELVTLVTGEDARRPASAAPSPTQLQPHPARRRGRACTTAGSRATRCCSGWSERRGRRAVDPARPSRCGGVGSADASASWPRRLDLHTVGDLLRHYPRRYLDPAS